MVCTFQYDYMNTDMQNKMQCNDCKKKRKQLQDEATKMVKNGELKETQNICGNCKCVFETFLNKLKKPSKTCTKCLEKERKIESKRDRSGRDYKQYESRPEVKERKQKWRKDNSEKCNRYCDTYRLKQLENNPEEYLERNNNNKKKWRTNNPEKVIINRIKCNNKPHSVYKTYKRSALKRGYTFELSVDELEKYITDKCFYCHAECIFPENEDDKIKYNGIDRIDNKLGYIPNNCVSCCKICNNIKNTMDINRFLVRCKNIYNPENANYDVTNNVTKVCYYVYRHRANKKNLQFELTKQDFNHIRMQNCYLCNKSNSNVHKNGVDRVDNSLGYTLENTKSCCGDCNFMKCELDLELFMDTIQLIVTNCIVSINLDINLKTNDVKNKNCKKMSKEETQEHAEIIKQHKHLQSIQNKKERLGIQDVSLQIL